jgi:hypothetical protein
MLFKHRLNPLSRIDIRIGGDTPRMCIKMSVMPRESSSVYGTCMMIAIVKQGQFTQHRNGLRDSAVRARVRRIACSPRSMPTCVSPEKQLHAEQTPHGAGQGQIEVARLF